jgi:3-oxoacyl-[acyl-carrier protein] reductase
MKEVALITGSSRGIGLGIAQQLADAGYNLVINGVRPRDAVAETIAELENRGAEVVYCQADISLKGDRDRMLSEIKRHYKRLDVLVNNAGIAPRERRDILEATEESFEELMQTNLQGPYFLTQAVANWMISQKQNDATFSGCIINITSVSATLASVNRGEYCIAKAGLSMATQLFASRLGEFNIPVFEIRPGIIRTDMTAAVTSKYDKLLEEGLTIFRRWGTPEDVGKAVLALVKNLFPYSTGQVIMVDGGITVGRL